MPGLPGGFTGYFYYKITSISGLYTSAILDLNADPASVTSTMKIWLTDPGPDPLAPIIPADLTLSWTGSTATAPIAPATASIWVLSTYELLSTAPALDNINNRFIASAPLSVPGPLPIFGAGAAFGFSRKLRAHVKASRSA